jgi:ribokinase
MSVPSLPVPGETVLGDEFAEGVGGKGSNQAVAAARLGADAAFVGRLGDDRFAADAEALWEREGVDANAVERLDGDHTGVGFVIVDEGGENAIAVAPGANAARGADAVRAAAETIRDADTLLTQLEIGDNAVAAALETASECGTEAVLNPAPARNLPDDLLAAVDALTPNRTEARILTGHDPDADVDDREIADRLLARGPNAVVLTRGADGALVVTDDGATAIPAIDPEVVDTTGAGDAFNAGFAVARAEGLDPTAAARFGTVAGGLACTAYEVVPALPTRGAVEARRTP